MGLKSQFEGGNMGNKGEIFFRINKYHDHVGFFKVNLFTFASLARPPVVRRFAHKNNLVILLIIYCSAFRCLIASLAGIKP